MVDPLRPFSVLVRSLLTNKANRAGSSTAANSQSSLSGSVNGPGATTPIQERLASRLPALQHWEESAARKTFVECILLAEFGDEIATDPDFPPLVEQVALHIGKEPKLSKRLDEVLRGLCTRSG